MSNEVGDFLAHYGVLGMKWGKRKADSQDRIDRGEHTSPKNPRQVKRAERKAERKARAEVFKKANTAVDKDIEKAREKIKKSDAEYKAARKEYREAKKIHDKKSEGRAAAKKALDAAATDNVKVWLENDRTASLSTQKESTDELINIVGGIALSLVVGSVLKKAAGR